MSVIPSTPEEITPEWLAEVLHTNPGEITSVNVRTAEAESGLVSLICFLELTSDNPSVPEKLVAKLAPTFGGAREVATAFRLFAREKQFYESIAPRLTIRAPKAWHCDVDNDTGLGILLLEDCSHLQAVDQTLEQPTSIAELELLIDAIAQLAISSWCAPWLDTESEILTAQHPVSKAYFGGLQEGFPELLKSEFMTWAPDGTREIAERLSEDFVNLVEAQPQGKQSLCHMDFRLANVFLDQGADNPVLVYDWQSMYPGRTAQDIGYLLATGYTPEFRRIHEKALVERYLRRLQEAGINDYSWDEAWFDYRHGIMIGFRLLPMSLGDLDVSSEGGATIFRKVFQVLPQAALDHGGVALIDEVLAQA